MTGHHMTSLSNRHMNKLLLSIMTMLACSLSSCGQQNFKTVDADEFEKTISADSVQLVDVRTFAEFCEARIASDKVVNIDALQPDFANEAVKKLDKRCSVAVYCRSGRRSADAAKKLSELGYDVIDLRGGILEWQKRGKPTTR